MSATEEPVVTDAVGVVAVGSPPKTIREFVGRVATGDDRLSVAVMDSPPGWSEPPQRPEFDEHTAVLSGALVVHHDRGAVEVTAGQAVLVKAGTRVRYETPTGAQYVAVCVPAFSPDTVHRDEAGM
ncbi:MAG: cupin domain-containing protein [Actinomycetota bacterium]|nr:cupin domain-containing protein [Actinomycetota bacterium]